MDGIKMRRLVVGIGVILFGALGYWFVDRPPASERPAEKEQLTDLEKALTNPPSEFRGIVSTEIGLDTSALRTDAAESASVRELIDALPEERRTNRVDKGAGPAAKEGSAPPKD